MTDEEKAKEWVRTNSGYSTKEFHGKKAIEAFLAGLKYNNKQIAELEKEKCELLGIIQAKDELIKKMKCCENCRHYSRTYGHCYSYDEYQNCKSLSNWRLAEC